MANQTNAQLFEQVNASAVIEMTSIGETSGMITEPKSLRVEWVIDGVRYAATEQLVNGWGVRVQASLTAFNKIARKIKAQIAGESVEGIITVISTVISTVIDTETPEEAVSEIRHAAQQWAQIARDINEKSIENGTYDVEEAAHLGAQEYWAAYGDQHSDLSDSAFWDIYVSAYVESVEVQDWYIEYIQPQSTEGGAE